MTYRPQWQYGATGTPELSYCAMQFLFWLIAIDVVAAVTMAAADRMIMTFVNIFVSPDHDERECSPDIAFARRTRKVTLVQLTTTCSAHCGDWAYPDRR